jgi:hypothetical protein
LRKLLLAVIVRTPKDRTRPVRKQTLGLTLDSEFGLLALDVEHDDLADARRNKRVLIDRQPSQRSKQLFLDVVRGKTTVAEGFQEEADGFEEVDFGVDDSVFETVLIEESDDFWEQLELVARGLVALAAFVVGFGGLRHAAAHFFDFLVCHLLQVDAILLAAARGAGALDEGVDLAVEGALSSCGGC